MKNQSKNAFTIVELVIVIAVISILSAILIPTFGLIIKQSNDVTASAELRNIKIKLEAGFVTENPIVFKNETNVEIKIYRNSNGTLWAEYENNNKLDKALNDWAELDGYGEFKIEGDDLIYTASNGDGIAIWENIVGEIHPEHIHNFVGGRCECDVSAPKCESCVDGDGDAICDVCGRDLPVPPETIKCDEHQWGNWYSIGSYELQCQDRTFERQCNVCLKYEQRAGNADDHRMELSHTIEASCTSPGYTVSQCVACPLNFITETDPKLKHVFNLEYDDRYHFSSCATCDEIDGEKEEHIYREDVCYVCNYKKPAPKQLIKVWYPDTSSSLIDRQIERFLEANPEYAELYTFEISHVDEVAAASQAIADVTLAPDIYCFSQDQLARLVQANALAAPYRKVANKLIGPNCSNSISAASLAGTLYAYPLASEVNGFFMYYDKSVITDPDDLAHIVADCESAGKNICFELGNAWYSASFFMATGCKSEWIYDMNTLSFTAIDDTYNSPEGLIAMKGMQIVTKSDLWVNSSTDFHGAGVVFSGIWDENKAREAFGDNFAAADLPSFTVDGESYHLSSFSSYKLMGVKPQSDISKAEMLSELALYLANEECQLERYRELNWIPTNIIVQTSDEIKNNVTAYALIVQNIFSVPQGHINGSWWDIAKVLGSESRTAETDADLQLALDTYTATIKALFQMSDEELSAWSAWSVIGNICGTNWDTDFGMTEKSAGVYESAVLDLEVGNKFKCRQGGSWTVNFGADGKIDGANYVVETAGKYFVRLTILSETSATIELIPQV